MVGVDAKVVICVAVVGDGEKVGVIKSHVYTCGWGMLIHVYAHRGVKKKWRCCCATGFCGVEWNDRVCVSVDGTSTCGSVFGI